MVGQLPINEFGVEGFLINSTGDYDLISPLCMDLVKSMKHVNYGSDKTFLFFFSLLFFLFKEGIGL